MKDGSESWTGGFDSKIDFKPGQKTRVAHGEACLKSHALRGRSHQYACFPVSIHPGGVGNRQNKLLLCFRSFGLFILDPLQRAGKAKKLCCMADFSWYSMYHHPHL